MATPMVVSVSPALGDGLHDGQEVVAVLDILGVPLERGEGPLLELGRLAAFSKYLYVAGEFRVRFFTEIRIGVQVSGGPVEADLGGGGRPFEHYEDCFSHSGDSSLAIRAG